MLLTSFCACFREGVVLGGSTEDKIEQYVLLLVLYGQYRWLGGEVSSNSHGGGERDATGALGFFKY
jgi:hypothetical protein